MLIIFVNLKHVYCISFLSRNLLVTQPFSPPLQKEAQSLNTAATANNTEAVKELKAQLEARTNQLAEQDQEIQVSSLGALV